MQVCVVVNTTAASVTRSVVRRAVGALAERAQVNVAETQGRGHGTELARRAVHDGARAVVVLGGDGTLNEVAGALVGTECALGALPGGSTSVFARTIGFTRDTVAAAELIGVALAQGSRRRIGLGRAGDRWFVLHTGIGWDAALVAAVERRPAAKRRFGQLPFVLAGIRTFTGGYDRRQPHFSVRFDDGELIEDAYFSLVLNSDPYTFVGPRPFVVSPTADLSSGLSVVTLTSMQLPGFLSLVSDALRGDGLSESRNVRIRAAVEGVDFVRRTTMPHQTDGDLIGDVGELRCTHHRDALEVLVPVARHVQPQRGP